MTSPSSSSSWRLIGTPHVRAWTLALSLLLAVVVVLATPAVAPPPPSRPPQVCTFSADFHNSGEDNSAVTYTGTLAMHPDPSDTNAYFIDTLTGQRVETPPTVDGVLSGTPTVTPIQGIDTTEHTPKFVVTSTSPQLFDVRVLLSGGIDALIDCDLGICTDTQDITIRGNGVIQASCNATIIGDPAFVGFLGQRFQVHGTPDTVHNVISAPHLLVNSLFVLLDHGECPVYDGTVVRGNCFAHPGTYFGELGFRTAANDRLLVRAGGAKEGFATVEMNGKFVGVGESAAASATLYPLSVKRTSTHTLTLRTELFEFDLENSDMFLNLLRVRIVDMRTVRKQDVHGLLGQTWRSRRASSSAVADRLGGVVREIDGTVDDYVELDNELFGSNVLFNRFCDESTEAEGGAEVAEVAATGAAVSHAHDDATEGKPMLAALRSRRRLV